MAQGPKMTETTTDQLLAGSKPADHAAQAAVPIQGGPDTPSIPLAPPGALPVPPPMMTWQPQPSRSPLTPKKVAILGTQPASRMLAPFNDPEWTIWGSSPGNMNILPRVDAWFEMHCNLLWPEYRAYGEPYLRWLNDMQFPVVAQDNKFIPRAIAYPLTEILAKFGRPQPYFFTSTFAFMMAYAIHVNAEEIGLYGVDMSSRDEYILQRAGGHHFICVAFDRGIKVTIPYESDLAQPSPLYGYSDASPYGRKMASRHQETKERIGQLETQITQAQNQLVYLRGALENQDYMRQVYGSVDQHSYNGFDRH